MSRLMVPRVREIMREVPVVAREDEPLMNVVRTMASRGIGSILIVDDVGRPVGVFTERDLLRLVANSVDLGTLTVGNVMTRPVVSIEESASLVKAVHVMAKGGFRHLPVIDDSGKLTGIVSIRDAAIALARLLVDLGIIERAVLSPEEALLLEEVSAVDVNEGMGY